MVDDRIESMCSPSLTEKTNSKETKELKKRKMGGEDGQHMLHHEERAKECSNNGQRERTG
jgi:hypothetical protein